MEDTLTMAQSLRHARHDFLNELQLIKMNLDLGRIEQAQAIIRSHAEAAVHASRLSALKLPRTEEWLLVSQWRFPEFQFRIECLANKAPHALDEEFAETLETIVQAIKGHMDPWQDYDCRIEITATAAVFTIKMDAAGNWADIEMPPVPVLQVRKECAGGRTVFTASAQMEG
ncbi:stage 0 sporulation protein B (sporulation initiation phosphotransferase) [Planomicrobium soli]|uniref:Stage 0 sporulation protein B (Sporulation initiation phosphotransferase) n=1 Tax=Planomicrobium soli TaxID=1176648 RepID=A0A2P8GME4_9BACL|nr:Spo0B domain-containing protein [Planomicrobium soli]PSL35129.1 stage 0 sporulation protein B (sporulation initiation phosphotransferase) [Planomicrobium soli]